MSSEALGSVVERIAIPNNASNGDSPPFANLYRVYHALLDQDGRGLVLDHSQERSFWLLWQWWQAYAQHCEVDPSSPETRFTRHTVNGQTYELHVQSYHFSRMVELFRIEFSNERISLAALQTGRQDAMKHSACQVVAEACLRERYVSDPPSVTSAYSRISDLRIRAMVISEWTDPVVTRLGPRDFAGVDRKCTSGASAQSCAWLETTEDLPHYLWDVQERRTIEVSKLLTKPSYVAVSHTWGRWRKEGCAARVTGVDLWTVPENSIFDVKQLPQLLACLPFDCCYVWFDLVCIPQDHSSIARQEIARQAAIFKNAKHAVIWFSTVPQWRGLTLAVTQIALDLWTQQETTTAAPCSIPDDDVPTGLFDPYDYSPRVSSSELHPHGWFSSLWTLQEACLRPDMWLCNSQMELSTVAAGTVPVAFNTIVALIDQYTVLKNYDAVLYEGEDEPLVDLTRQRVAPSAKFGSLVGRHGYKRGYLELCELLDRTGMNSLSTLRRDQILLLGSTRFCLHSRAEAIMSVIGVTDWSAAFQIDDERSQVDNCVLGQYPLEFVREVAAKQGWTFFNSISTSQESIASMHRRQSRGSLLPFQTASPGPSTESKFVLDRTFETEEATATIDTWQIQQSGSLKLSAVSIVASSRLKPLHGVRASIWLTFDAPSSVDPKYNVQGNEKERVIGVDLQDWCQSYFPSSANHAVELGTVNGISCGVLLKELSEDTSVFYKVGNYIHAPGFGNRDPHVDKVTWAVDWTVL